MYIENNIYSEMYFVVWKNKQEIGTSKQLSRGCVTQFVFLAHLLPLLQELNTGGAHLEWCVMSDAEHRLRTDLEAKSHNPKQNNRARGYSYGPSNRGKVFELNWIFKLTFSLHIAEVCT